MLKTTFKVIMLFVLLAFVAVASGLATYTVTRNMVEEQLAQAHETSSPQQITEIQQAETASHSQSKDARAQQDEYYFVRLEGDTLEVYIAHSGKEEFLYNRKVYKNDLSESDLEMLHSGVMLESASELTAFIENFTS